MNKIKFIITVEKEIDGYIEPEDLHLLEDELNGTLETWKTQIDNSVKSLSSEKVNKCTIRLSEFEMKVNKVEEIKKEEIKKINDQVKEIRNKIKKLKENKK